MTFNDSNVVIRDPRVAWRQVEGAVMAVSPHTSQLHTLDGVGCRIWELLESAPQVGALIETLVSEYEVEPDRCASETEEFLKSLLKKELIRVDGSTETQP